MLAGLARNELYAGRTELSLEAQLGKIETAIDRLRAPGSEPILVHRLHVHPIYAPLRGTPLVQERLRDAGLDERSIRRTLEELGLQADLARGSHLFAPVSTLVISI